MNETIMIVDDSLFISEGLVAILKRKGYTTIPALSGVECLEILKTMTPDLILLDIMMEPMDGWETLGRLKTNPATKGIPVLMFSAKKISPSEALEHSINIDDFVTKPVNPVQLLESIQRIFNRRKNGTVEEFVAPDTDLNKALIDEYTTLPTSIEVDKDLLAILKNSTGANTPGYEVPADDFAAMQKLEEKIRTDEQRLKDLSETRTVLPTPTVVVSPSAEPEIKHSVPTTEQTPVSDSIPVPPGTPAIPVVIPSGSIPKTPVSHTPRIRPTIVMSQSTEPEIKHSVPTTEQTPVSDSIPVPPVTPAVPVVIPSGSIPKTPVPHTPGIKPTLEVSPSGKPAIKESVPKREPTVVIKKGIPVLSYPTSPAPERSAGTPVPKSGKEETKSKTLIVVAVIIVILVVAVCAFVLLKSR
jgi:two-component system OmpR family response regulator